MERPATADELAELTREYAEGETDAFAAILRICTPRLTDRVRRTLPAWALRLQLDTDIVQETLSRLARYRRSFRFDGQVYRWLRLTMCSVRKDTLEREERHAEALLRDPYLAEGAVADGREEAFTRDSLLSVIVTAPPRDRDVLVLRLVCACTFDEIAARLGISRTGAVGRFQRARVRLIDRLSEVTE